MRMLLNDMEAGAGPGREDPYPDRKLSRDRTAVGFISDQERAWRPCGSAPV